MIFALPPHLFFAGSTVTPEALNKVAMAAYSQMLPEYAKQLSKQFIVSTEILYDDRIATLMPQSGLVQQVERIHISLIHEGAFSIEYGTELGGTTTVNYPAQATSGRWVYTIPLNQTITASTGPWFCRLLGGSFPFCATVHFATRRLDGGSFYPIANSPILLRDGNTFPVGVLANNKTTIDNMSNRIRLSSMPQIITRREFSSFDDTSPEAERYTFLIATIRQEVVRIYGKIFVEANDVTTPTLTLNVNWGTETPTVLDLAPAIAAEGNQYDFLFNVSLDSGSTLVTRRTLHCVFEGNVPVRYCETYYESRRI